MEDFFTGFDRNAGTPGAIHLRPSSLLRHMMALGSSGSGKTVLCKVLTEEFIRSGIPAICIDPQGDLCSLALHADDPEFLREKGVDPALAAEFRRRVDPVIFTPASRKGIALSADPIATDVDALKARDRVYAISSIATMVVSLLGYDLESDDGAGLTAVFDRALNQLQKAGRFPRNLEQFTNWLLHLDDDGKEGFARYLDVRKLDHACQKLARLDVGARRLLFHEGLALDVNLLLGKGQDTAAVEGRTRLSIIYLNSLHSQEDKEFFLAALAERLYSWMLKNPSGEPQALFYIDEVAPFIPPVRKPACKPALQLLFKQARKYGVCCLMATQNPADVDYKAMAQFGTWAIGRLTTRQDMKKVQPTVKSLDPVNVDRIMSELPSHKPGQFVLISPDNFDSTRRLQCRWLYTRHETLDDEAISDLMDVAPADAPGVQTPRERLLELERRLEAVRPEEPATIPEENAPAQSSSAKSSPVEKKPAPGKTAPEKKGDVTQAFVDPELEENDRRLAKRASLSVKEFAARNKLSSSKARSALKKLVASGRAKMWKEGREHRYYSVSTGLRPDLGLDEPVQVMLSRITRNDAEKIGRRQRGRSFLGFIGEDEELDRMQLEYRLAIQIGFTEKVTRMFLKRLFGPRHDEMLDNVYLHPESLKIATFDENDGIALHERPGDYASRIIDFDGAVVFEKKPPGEVPFRESDFRTRKEDDAVKASFKRRYDASPRKVKPVFIPVWNLHMKTRGRGGHRIVTIDALVGKPLHW